MLRCVVRDGAGNALVAHVEAAPPDPNLRAGAALWAAWPSAAARLFHPDAPDAPDAAAAPGGWDDRRAGAAE